MTRSRTALSLALTAVLLATACSPTGGDLEDHILGTVADASTVPVRDLVAQADVKRFTMVCPYEQPVDVAARLEVTTHDVPDLSDRDDAQALVVVTSDGVEAAEFSRDRVDLCSAGDEWPAYSAEDDATVNVVRGDAGLVLIR